MQHAYSIPTGKATWYVEIYLMKIVIRSGDPDVREIEEILEFVFFHV